MKTQFKRVGGGAGEAELNIHKFKIKYQGGGGGAGGAELNTHKFKIKYQAAKLLSFFNLQMLKMIYFSFVIVH